MLVSVYIFITRFPYSLLALSGSSHWNYIACNYIAICPWVWPSETPAIIRCILSWFLQNVIDKDLVCKINFLKPFSPMGSVRLKYFIGNNLMHLWSFYWAILRVYYTYTYHGHSEVLRGLRDPVEDTWGGDRGQGLYMYANPCHHNYSIWNRQI